MLEDHPIQQVLRGLVSWRTMWPRLTSNEVTDVFLEYGGKAWVLRTAQVGGDNPDIEPIAPMII